MESASIGATYGGRPTLGRPPLARLPDRALKWGLAALSAGILALIGYFFVRLYVEANPAFQKFGFFGFTPDLLDEIGSARGFMSCLDEMPV